MLSILQTEAGNPPPVGTAVPHPHPETVTIIEHVEKLPFGSFTVNVMLLFPSVRSEPGAGL